MKKLKLNTNAQGSALNRNELKKVLGGVAGSGDEENPCKDKNPGDTCIIENNNTVIYGVCVRYLNQPLICSTLI